MTRETRYPADIMIPRVYASSNISLTSLRKNGQNCKEQQSEAVVVGKETIPFSDADKMGKASTKCAYVDPTTPQLGRLQPSSQARRVGVPQK